VTNTVNESTGTGGWLLLATNRNFAQGMNGNVRITNLGSPGKTVVADAMRWVYDEDQGTIIVPPGIAVQPMSQAVAAGSNVVFNVSAAGTGPLAYEWRLNSQAIPGATANSCLRTNVQTADAGSYVVVVTNAAGSVTSAVAMLTVNHPPVLASVSDQTIYPGSTLIITNTATDTDFPTQRLSFSLDPGAPAGANVGSTNGVLVWTAAPGFARTTNLLTVRVTDDGVPSLSDARSFKVVVAAPLAVRSITLSGSNVNVQWDAIPGKIYNVQYKISLVDTNWLTLPPPVTATGTTASKVDAVGVGTRYYRVLSN
jgi:hypothetical protein